MRLSGPMRLCRRGQAAYHSVRSTWQMERWIMCNHVGVAQVFIGPCRDPCNGEPVLSYRAFGAGLPEAAKHRIGEASGTPW
jgi:hypothetical protein